MRFGAGVVLVLLAGPLWAQDDPCAGVTIFCDDFTTGVIDPLLWTYGDQKIAGTPVRPENIALTARNDKGRLVTVVDAMMFGDLHVGKKRQGGVLVTKARYGGGRYEVRMRNLPGPNGCSCFWTYYDSLNDPNPPLQRIYTEIDIEMPARLNVPPGWPAWRKVYGFNTWSKTDGDADASILPFAGAINPFDGEFHVFRFDWRDGPKGARKVTWYVDGIMQATTQDHVSGAPAQVWVGNWPAPWPEMRYDFDIAHQYIDWVRITALP